MNLQPHTLLIVSLGGYVIGAVAGLLFMRRERLANVVSFGAASLSALIGLFAGWFFLAGGTGTAAPQNELLPALNPYIRFTIRLDPLGAFFLLIILKSKFLIGADKIFF